jgi:hypothetical protein
MGRLSTVTWAGVVMILAGGGVAVGAEGLWEGLPANRWVEVHRQREGDTVRFWRQEHGGSCFDSRRGRLILFGSNTHGEDWENSPLIFDTQTLQWSRLYPWDEVGTYTVTAEGLPVAGPRGDHPWAMHTFGAVEYDPERDEMVVCSYPEHLKPGRFTDALAGVWDKVKRHPTWVLELGSGRWRPLACPAVHFFPYCTVYDSKRKVIVGYRPEGVFELSGEPREWKRVETKGYLGYHTNSAYDAANEVVVVFGSNENANDVVVYRPGAEHGVRPTPGVRPPKDQHAPMCYEPRSQRVVVVVDAPEAAERTEAQTWLYDTAADAWQQLPAATLPFPLGMNYTMEYDPGHGVCLLVARTPGEGGWATAVLALRVERPGQGK